MSFYLNPFFKEDPSYVIPSFKKSNIFPHSCCWSVKQTRQIKIEKREWPFVMLSINPSLIHGRGQVDRHSKGKVD